MISSTFRLQNYWQAVLFVLAAIIIQSCGPKEPDESFTFTPYPGLSSDERTVERRYASQISENLRAYIGAYRFYWGKVVNTDSARELSVDYAPDGPDAMTPRNLSHRARYTQATQGPSRELAVHVYRQMLTEQTRPGEEARVVFTAGGAGSGKSTSISNIPDVQAIVDNAQIVFDTTFSSPQTMELIQQALTAQKTVTIVYVYRDPPEAFEGMIERARATGRPVSLTNFLETHLGAPRMVGRVRQQFSADVEAGRLNLLVVDNTANHPNQATLVRDNPAGFLANRASAFTETQLRQDLRRRLRDALRTQRIDRDMFNQINR
jgi:hypothetical protein